MTFTYNRVALICKLFISPNACLANERELEVFNLITSTYPEVLDLNWHTMEDILTAITYKRILLATAESIDLLYIYEIGGAARSPDPEIRALAKENFCYKFKSESKLMDSFVKQRAGAHQKFIESAKSAVLSPCAIYFYTWSLLTDAIGKVARSNYQTSMCGFETTLLKSELNMLCQRLDFMLGDSYTLFEFFVGML